MTDIYMETGVGICAMNLARGGTIRVVYSSCKCILKIIENNSTGPSEDNLETQPSLAAVFTGRVLQFVL